MTTNTASPATGITKYTAPSPNSAVTPKKDITASANGSALKETDFLHLLTTQLEHQDPLNPEKDTDFAAQMAQYSSLAETRKLSDTLLKQAEFNKVSNAASLIGKTVTTIASDGTGKPVTGVVSTVNITPDGTVLLKVGDTSVPVEHISGIMQTAPQPVSAGTTSSAQTTAPSANGPAPTASELAPQATAQPAASVSPFMQAAVQRAEQQSGRALPLPASQPAPLTASAIPAASSIAGAMSAAARPAVTN